MRENLPIVAIVGRTNVGKSSLTNAMLGYGRTIVAREEGTTRDSIFAVAEHEGKKFWLADTAGLKKAADDFETTIQEQIQDASESANLVLVVVEAGSIVSDEDTKVAKLARSAQKDGKEVILVINKLDKLKEDLSLEQNKWRRLGIDEIMFTSAIHKDGIEELLDRIIQTVPSKSKYDKTDLAIAFLGRPNVGKSSIFNAIAKKQQAVVADVAGTTRDINSIRVKYHGKNIELLDTAGIRRPGKVKHGLEKFSVIKSLRAVQQADVCVVLIDASELATGMDQRILGMVKDANRGLIIAVSKWDIFEDKDSFSSEYVISKLQSELQFVPWAPLVFTSSVDGKNLNKLIELAIEVKSERERKIKTTDLNKWLQAAVAQHEIPSAKGNLHPRIQYAIQEEGTPYPSFQLFGNHVRKIHWGYKRYLENSLRKEFKFTGTPIEIWFIQKEVRGEKKKTSYKDALRNNPNRKT
jgi:GTP-binding protein